jgi:hypothetical protein
LDSLNWSRFEVGSKMFAVMPLEPAARLSGGGCQRGAGGGHRNVAARDLHARRGATSAACTVHGDQTPWLPELVLGLAGDIR